MSKEYVSGVGGAGKARFLFKRISEGGFSNTRVFAFVKDEELSSFYEDVKTFFENQNGKIAASQKGTIPKSPTSAFEVLLLPEDDVQRQVLTVDKIKNLNNFIVCASDISINSPLPNPCVESGVLLKQNQNIKFANFAAQLIKMGYSRVNFVEDKLQFSVRGDIIDIWPAANETPVRILFEYETIDAIRTFDAGAQLSNGFIEEIKILSVNASENTAVIKDYFKLQNGNPCVESGNGGGKTNNADADRALLYFDYIISQEEEEEYKNFDLIVNSPVDRKSVYQGYKSFTGFQGDINFFVNSLKSFAKSGVNIRIYCANTGEQERIADIFYDNKWDGASPEFFYGVLSAGFYNENEELAVISSREMLYKKKPASFPKIKGGRRLEGIWEISLGDFVVHEKYGIGRFKGLKTISRDDKTSEYLCIEYAKGDKLYVPPEEIKTVKKYVGVEGVKPKLYSMDSFSWERAKSRAREAAAKFAQELLKLYAQRSMTKRAAYGRQSVWEKELEDSFPYNETPDQLKAIEDVKSDFLKPYPMERLICGDVGYGKTEVAVRAAFKVVQEGFQAAVLAPTTILAQQHYNTFNNRLSLFPTKLAVLSRFQSKAKQKEILQDLQDGKIDIVVGTHRLLQKDVAFKNLGILIIDEEHRFGVKQKEKIKSVKKNIDVLMLSATPIPRTLSAALSGFRDLSVIETPPLGRLPIDTSLSLYDEKLVKNIIEAELSRNGQVFYVYNKVETILTKAAQLQKLVPEIKLGVIHGQMKAKDIEEIMWKFTNMELDVLLATTIIESGLDIPSVNTMLVEEAENFGLSQLYQLRGRIGRERKKAYCYLFYKDRSLSDEAVKRLEAMKEFSELGSGFRLALKDLEIRGAGAILSSNQHGFIRDIGYDMFSKLLEEEGKKVKGETFESQKEQACEIDLQAAALIPNTYIEDDEIRILFYRKLSDAKDNKKLEEIKAELIDRFGRIPSETQKLFEITSLRFKAQKLKLERVSEDNQYVYMYFSPSADFSKADISKLINDYTGVIEFISGKNYAFKLRKNQETGDSAQYINVFMDKLNFYLKL
ncbi:MAG: transcription-repair coupling factor [Endomicrobium sp.]|jgi:transcription-repair coupling factor (superfamily II helicase)|nr:transcription-repair coupling factor [Endomicrobium sp.]